MKPILRFKHCIWVMRMDELLSIRDLNVYYGSSHALQGVDLSIEGGIHAVIGRNGMGKTTLCNAIMGLLPVASGIVKFQDRSIVGLLPHRIARAGIGFTPQGRRLWASLSVDEHLRLCAKRGRAWSVERIYNTFPRLAERKNNGGAQLSGGEQQMLALSRALLQDPKLLVLDEPTEGLAPVIVDHVKEVLASIAAEDGVSILLVEQNISVATEISQSISVMVNGQITSVLSASELSNNVALQQQLMGVGRL